MLGYLLAALAVFLWTSLYIIVDVLKYRVKRAGMRAREKYLQEQDNIIKKELKRYDKNIALLEDGYFESQVHNNISSERLLRRWEVIRQCD